MNLIEKLGETLILVFIVKKEAQRETLQRDVIRTQKEPRSSEVESSAGSGGDGDENCSFTSPSPGGQHLLERL